MSVVRRVIPADNGCLFNAVGYVLGGHSRSEVDRLRHLIAETVFNDPETYNEAFLGKQPEDYTMWILMADSWGGAIELSILCKHYHTVIAVCDIQSSQIVPFGESEGYNDIAYIIYDGIHYDALALCLEQGAPEECDVTVFPRRGREAESTEAQVRAFMAREKSARKFTDTSKFDLQCLVCGSGLVGQKGAIDHASKTGHTNFAQVGSGGI
ncbi:ubiquitin thioesterase OTU1 [Pelomyxa schiedti]|nr:ubiquitin thioesterase OTU1 [Pelomyxa schiedti]